jgi:hypothetical protein
MWRMPRPSTLIQMPLAATNKMSIMCGYLRRVGLRPRLPLQLARPRLLQLQLLPRLPLRLQLQLRQRLPPRLQPQPHLRLHQLQQLLQDRRQRRDLSPRPDRVRRHVPERSYRCSIPVLAGGPRLDRARRLQQGSSDACAVRIFRFQSGHD